MRNDLLLRAEEQFGTLVGDTSRPRDARSAAGVHRVRTPDGRLAYLKLTPEQSGSAAIEVARHELEFYLQFASRVPVSTPPLLGSLDIEAGIALLLGDAGEQVPAEAWSDQAWTVLGRELARLHATPVTVPEMGPDYLLKLISEPPPDQVRQFWSPALPDLPDLLAARHRMSAEIAGQPTGFVHGDCHTGNIVHGAHGLVFCDWQSFGIGRATADLVHLSVRATPSGATLSPALISAYTQAQGTEIESIERALIPAELAVLIFQWPQYAAYNSQVGIERVRERARLLASNWLHERL